MLLKCFLYTAPLRPLWIQYNFRHIRTALPQCCPNTSKCFPSAAPLPPYAYYLCHIRAAPTKCFLSAAPLLPQHCPSAFPMMPLAAPCILLTPYTRVALMLPLCCPLADPCCSLLPLLSHAYNFSHMYVQRCPNAAPTLPLLPLAAPKCGNRNTISATLRMCCPLTAPFRAAFLLQSPDEAWQLISFTYPSLWWRK